MAYLTKDDYTISISINHVDQILTQAATSSGLTVDQIRVNSEQTAESEINAYLSKYYDIAEELAKTTTSRNKLVIRCYVNISLYNLFATISGRDIPEMRKKLYDDSIDLLKAYRDGHLDFGLTVIDADGDGNPDVSTIEIVSHRKFISKPYADPNTIS
jgi:hypothetical protein